MGVAYYISPAPVPAELGHIDCEVGGKVLAAISDFAINRVCREANVLSLSTFFSQDPEAAQAFCEDEGIDPPSGGFPPEQWFDAGEGVRTFQTLLARSDLLANRRVTVDQITAELTRFIEVLTTLQEHGVRWHLSVDF